MKLREFITFRWEYGGESVVVTLRWPTSSEWSQFQHQSNSLEGNRTTDPTMDARVALVTAVLFDIQGFSVDGCGREIVLGRACCLTEEELAALSQDRGFPVKSWKDLVPGHWRIRWTSMLDKVFLEGKAVPLDS